ncbi:glycosyltransferase [Sphingorhabdus lutea]|uniref:glycosyltransferase n=1 Tax=Sphingorhabdus lutea TaxID=1913578 RepID=UPI0018DEA397|nr:glycosyltransferase [Sphingorhabdus lutea]
MAHNEEERIEKCIRSILAENGDFPIYIIINGSTDETANIVRNLAKDEVRLHPFIYEQGGKSRSWNRFVMTDLPQFADYNIFIDGDAEILSGSFAAMAKIFAKNDMVNAVAAPPMNGRSAEYYRKEMIEQHYLFGDLYALSGDLLTRMKEMHIKLPDDLIGDDGYLCSIAKTNLQNEDFWKNERVAICQEAGFYCEPISYFSPKSWKIQYRRMINYSVRHFQNKIITQYMRDKGPISIPVTLSEIYANHLPNFTPRGGINAYFDRLALKKMREQILRP